MKEDSKHKAVLTPQRRIAELREVIRAGRRLVVFTHDNPDPDTIAAAWALARIAEHLGRESAIYYGGHLGRAENRAMVRLLHVPIKKIPERGVRLSSSDVTALVDTQAGTGNNSFPSDLDPDIIIDHHPSDRPQCAPFLDIRQEDGCTAAIMLEYLLSFGLQPDAELATAVAYAIISETQDLEREASTGDREAYEYVLPLARLPLLGSIRHPARDREYYRTIARAMRGVQLARHTCVCHIGRIPYSEVVAEVADFLVSMERVTWCLVSGLTDGRVSLSLRTTHVQGHAGKVMRKLVSRIGKGGGHRMIAGGMVPCPQEEDYTALSEKLTQRLLKQLPHRFPEKLKPLLDE